MTRKQASGDVPSTRKGAKGDVQVKRERFMPFRFLPTAIEMTPTRLRVDEDDVLEDESRHELRLDGQRWSTIHVRLSLHIDGPALEQVLPAPVRLRPPVRWVVVLDAPHTRFRRVVSLGWPSPESTLREREAEFVIHARDIAGAIKITPWLVRNEAGEAALQHRTAHSTGNNSSTGYGTADGHRLASGRSFVIYPEPTPIRRGNFLDVRYKAFSKDSALKAGRLYHLTTLDEPILWINADHATIADVLNAKGQTGLSARLREVFFDTIAQGVWTQLFLRAVDALSPEGDSLQPWQEGVLVELLPKMFPKHPTHAARVHELLAVREESLGMLAELCDLALQDRDDVVKHMSRLIERSRTGGRT